MLDEIAADQNPWWVNPQARGARKYPVARDMLEALSHHLGRDGTRRAAILLGPRQVGKTVLLLQLADHALDAGWPPSNVTYFNFDDDRLTSTIKARRRSRVGALRLQSGVTPTLVARRNPAGLRVEQMAEECGRLG